MTVRRIVPRAAAVAGWVALAASLLLASPGVRVARADDAAEFQRFERFSRGEQAAPSVRSGASCQAAAGLQRRMAAAEWMRKVQQMAAAQMKPGTPAVDMGNGLVLLNNRGYNYGPGPQVDTARIEREMRGR